MCPLLTKVKFQNLVYITSVQEQNQKEVHCSDQVMFEEGNHMWLQIHGGGYGSEFSSTKLLSLLH